MKVTDDKSENLKKAYSMLKEAKAQGADTAILPEMFCISYRRSLFRKNAEILGEGDAYNMLQHAAAVLHLNIIGGSVPEICGESIYNTSMCFLCDGTFSGAYRKAHLFDVDFENTHFRESDVITAGNGKPLFLDIGLKAAVSICFDIRFPEWARIAFNEGAELLCLPAAFARATGKAHWELLLRARALDNQMYVAGCAPATCEFSHGHSMIVNPNGEVICDLGEDEYVKTVELSHEAVERMRRAIPIKEARRTDLY